MTDYLTPESWEAANRKEQALVAAEEDADRRDALAAALKRDDEVYISHDPTYGLRVFGHRDDAETYALKRYGHNAGVRSAKVLDHAEARRLIEQED